MKQILKSGLFGILIFLSHAVQSQSDIWYVGNNVKIDFTSGSAVVSGGIATDLGGLLNESSTSVSDGNGNPLIVVIGSQVFDGGLNEVLKLPSLVGDVVNGSLLFPVPGKQDSYFLTVMREGSYAREKSPMAQYYEIAVSGAGAGNLSVQGPYDLDSNLLQGQTGVSKLHIDGSASNEYWMLSHEKCNNQFVSYSVTQSGITRYKVSSAGSQFVCDTMFGIFNNISNIKFNHCQNRFVMTHNSDLLYFGFDRATGEVSFLDSIQGLDQQLYGLEFSPSGDYLYLTRGSDNNYAGKLYSVRISGNRLGEVKDMGFTGGMRGGHLQLGPDGNIYFAVPRGYGPAGDGFVGRITDPNNGGVKDSSWYVAKKENWSTSETEAQLVTMDIPQFIKPVVNEYANLDTSNCSVLTDVEAVASSSLSVFPNPTNGDIYVSDFQEGAKFEVFDLKGLKVKQGMLNHKISLDNLPKGAYVFRIIGKEEVFRILLE